MIAVPSWLNEKRPDVNVSRVLWASVVFSTLLFLMLGMKGATSYNWASCDILSLLDSPNSQAWDITLVANDVFPLAALLSGIPV